MTKSSVFRMVHLRAAALLSLATLLSAATSGAQAIYTFKAEAHLVNMAFSVHALNGAPMAPLTQQDITITEDGVPQTIRFFAGGQTLPLSIGLIIDASGSQQSFTRAHERDLEEFFRDVLQPQDQAFAVCFGNHLRLVSDFSSSPQTLTAGLHRFDSDGHGDRDFPEIGPKEDRELGTALYDALFFATSEKLAARTQTRKVLLVMSDGEENASEHDLLDTISAAQGSDVVIYALRYTDAHKGEMSARNRYGMRVLDHLTEQTGGKSYDVRAVETKQAFAEIAAELRSTYEVAYQPTNLTHDGLFRKVEIHAVPPALVVRSRPGYYAR